MSDTPSEAADTPDAGEIEWAGTVSKKPPHADGEEQQPVEPEPDPLDGAERVGDHRYPG